MTGPARGKDHGRPPPAAGGMAAGDPFRVLGLDASADLTDDEVRAAWRRIAAATHPDRADRGDPAAFAAASAAYTALRTRSARGEALADLQAALARHGAGSGRGWHARPLMAAVRLTARIRGGRPGRLALRLLAVAAITAGTRAAVGLQPACPALVTGAVTWLILTGRRDLAPARRKGRDDGSAAGIPP
ncbi:MAG: DnaJ domain-containing protein [Streptosporangiaceae bacterium]|jgi:curved DNA-binding protein CbpA